MFDDVKDLLRLLDVAKLVLFRDDEINIDVGMNEIAVGGSSNSPLDAHQAVFFCTLENRLRFEYFGMSRGILVGPDPADVFASSEAPFLQAVSTLKTEMLNKQLDSQIKDSNTISRPSELPHHRKTKDRCDAIASISKFKISSQFQKLPGVLVPLKYSSNGGSIKITSNFTPKFFKSNDFRSVFKYIGGVAVSDMSSSFRRINSLSLGYSSKRSANPTSRMKF